MSVATANNPREEAQRRVQWLATNKRVGLKAVKYLESNSEETACFTATLTLDGHSIAKVSNSGRGGANHHEPVKAGQPFAEALAEAEGYAASLADESMGDDVDLEVLEFELLMFFLARRDYKRAARKYVLYTATADLAEPLMQVAIRPAGAEQSTIAMVRERRPEAVILNALPVDEATAKFIVHCTPTQ